MHRKSIIIGVIAGVLAVSGGAAFAASHGEVANLIPPGAPSGYLTINKGTCRFVHREIDVMPTATERYARAEDSRDDILFNCLRNKSNRAKVGAPGPRGPRGPAGPAGSGALAGYVQVTASGTGASVTVTCPEGDVVLGGGSPAEFTASYPSSASSWTIGRDHLSPKTLVVIATCATGAAS
jgi:hypothetical protein